MQEVKVWRHNSGFEAKIVDTTNGPRFEVTKGDDIFRVDYAGKMCDPGYYWILVRDVEEPPLSRCVGCNCSPLGANMVACSDDGWRCSACWTVYHSSRPMWRMRHAFASLSTAMSTPQGRRILAQQAVDDAVDHCPAELDKDAYRYALMAVVENCLTNGWDPTPDLKFAAVHIEDGCFPSHQYHRFLANKNAKPLGRPHYSNKNRGW